jgi:hypothetical protein
MELFPVVLRFVACERSFEAPPLVRPALLVLPASDGGG